MEEGCGYACNGGTESRPKKLRNCDEYIVPGDLGLAAYGRLIKNSMYVDAGGRYEVRLMFDCAVVVVKNLSDHHFRFTSENVEHRLRAAETIGLIARTQEALDSADDERIFEIERARPDRD